MTDSAAVTLSKRWTNRSRSETAPRREQLLECFAEYWKLGAPHICPIGQPVDEVLGGPLQIIENTSLLC